LSNFRHEFNLMVPRHSAKTTLSIMTFIIMGLIIMTLSITALSVSVKRLTLMICLVFQCVLTLSAVMSNVVIRSVMAPT